jgi:uncharacterized protein with GYD domain
MPKYLTQVSYTVEGVKGLLKEGATSRQDAIRALIESVGGKLETFYFAFGPDDLIVIADLPDNTTPAALSMATAASGFATARTTVLLTPEEIDQACKAKVAYRPPGAPRRARRSAAAASATPARKRGAKKA